MCNEYRLQVSLDELIQEFSRLGTPLSFEGGAPNLEPRLSIRPTDPAPVVVGGPGGALLRQLRWGFPPPRPKAGPVINFRSDGRRFGNGRCLIPADGFYEFTGTKSPKSKWLFEPMEGGVFAIAGLVREDRFTMLTCPPGPDIAPYHDRQIVIMPKEHWAAWIGLGDAPPFGPLPAGSLKVTQVR